MVHVGTGFAETLQEGIMLRGLNTALQVFCKALYIFVPLWDATHISAAPWSSSSRVCYPSLVSGLTNWWWVM